MQECCLRPSASFPPWNFKQLREEAMKTLLTLAGAILYGVIARGATIDMQTYSGPLTATISGNLTNQGTALEEGFDLPMNGNLTIFSTSYASGGFSPNLMLFDSNGNFVAASSPAGFADPKTGLVGDASFTANNLQAGMY